MQKVAILQDLKGHASLYAVSVCLGMSQLTDNILYYAQRETSLISFFMTDNPGRKTFPCAQLLVIKSWASAMLRNAFRHIA